MVSSGILVMDKPAGPTSFEVVRRVRSLLKVEKAGHTGTLDPLATGVLPICVGAATKIAGFIIEGKKSYDALIRLGVETDTLDAAGQPISQAPVPNLSVSVLEGVLAKFRGSYLQVPPMFSAIKVGGRRLHELARMGKTVQREPRRVEVYELALRDFSSTDVAISLTCSKGFFVRALAHDIGRELGCGGHLKALRRTSTGPFTLERALTLDRLAALISGPSGEQAIDREMISMNEALVEMPALQVSAADARRVVHGVPIECAAGSGRVRVLGPDGMLLAIGERGQGPRLHYHRVLANGMGE